MSHFELCGFKADQHGAFPIEAYYAFCEKRGIPFPFDWQPKGQKKRLFTTGEAVLKIFELPENIFTPDNFGNYMFDGVAGCLYQLFNEKICFDEEHYSASLGSYSVKNPFNQGDVCTLAFPREAFFEVWSADRRGMDVPRWFADLDKGEGKKQSYAEVKESVKITVPATAVPSAKTSEVADELMMAAVPSVDDIQLISGVTVANIRALFDKDNPRYRPPLAAAVWLWCSFESKGVPVGMTPKQEAKRRLGAEIPPAISTDWTDKADEEILKMVNWQKKPKKE